jgi:hypothetical protein
VAEIDIEFGGEHIPVSFDFEGKPYTGYLSFVNGAGGYHWHLMVNKFYWGVLVNKSYEWVFHDQKNELKEYADYFGDVLQAWYE